MEPTPMDDTQRPPQEQDQQPGLQHEMDPEPVSEKSPSLYSGEQKLSGKTAIVTGGDSGIGRAVAVAFAEAGAHVVVAYLDEQEDAEKTARMVEEKGAKVLLVPGDVGEPEHCSKIVDKAIMTFGSIDVLVNNAGVQYPQENIGDISPEQLLKTFRTNIFSQFYLVQAALPHMKKGSCIINTASVTAYKGSPQLLDYSATKGAIVSFTRSLSIALAEKGIRVNAVAPGPIWTPLIPATFPAEKVAKFGHDVPMKRAGEPAEVAPCYLFLSTDASSYISGQVLHPNGGEVVNG
ncbi:glucose 1-dehydrogenase [Compostibacter hankyongensis]|uniref:SDR family oxidoreductase n=1 Tax=Compostibacter hankyongensis TaxID=1007089 RepID=A0ABP8FYP5_9BACT